MQASTQLKDGYFESRLNAMVVPVLPGEHRVIDVRNTAVCTLLGSCVAACIRDTRTGIGGLNHFLLPNDDSSSAASASARYGAYAMEVLINDILKTGATRDRLEAKAFGGGNVIASANPDSVGRRNARFVAEYLRNEGIRLAASDLGGDRARRVYFFPDTGRAVVQRLPVSEARSAVRAEAQLSRTITVTKPKGSVELF